MSRVQTYWIPYLDLSTAEKERQGNASRYSGRPESR
jgi:hypothetical protein